MYNKEPLIICPVCGIIDKSLVEIYNTKLRKQSFVMSPIVPTCRHCASEIEIINSSGSAELIILNGTCGSGKSTIAEELMKRFGYAVIDGDCVLQAVRYKLNGAKVEYNSKEALDEIAHEIDILTALGDRIVLSHIILPEDLNRYITMFLRRKLRFRHILLKPNIDTVISRCNIRTCHKSITPEYWIRYFHERLMYNDSTDISVIDNTDLSVDETIIRILEITV